MSPVLTARLSQLQRDLRVAESIPSVYCEDLMVWTALELQSGDRNSEQQAVVAAWKRLLAAWLTNDLESQEQPITQQALSRIVSETIVTWLLSKGDIVGTRSPALVVRAIPGEELTALNRVSSDPERDGRTLATIRAMVEQLDAAASDTSKTAQLQMFARAWASILRTEFPNYAAGAAEHATERLITLVHPAKREACTITITTGQRPWFPRCDDQHAVDFREMYAFRKGDETITLKCQKGHSFTTAMSNFGCGWFDNKVIVWTDDSIREAMRASNHSLAPRPQLQGRAAVAFQYPPSIVDLATTNDRERLLIINIPEGTQIEPVDSGTLYKRVPVQNATQGVIISPVKPQYRYLNKQPPRRSSLGGAYELTLTGLPTTYLLHTVPTDGLPPIAIVPDPKLAPSDWQTFRVLTTSSVTVRTTTGAARQIRPAAQGSAVWDTPREELHGYLCIGMEVNVDEGCDIWLPATTEQTKILRGYAIGIDFGTTHSLMTVRQSGNINTVTRERIKKAVIRWVNVPSELDQQTLFLANSGSLFPSELCQHGLIAMEAMCCERIDRLFKSEPQRSEVRKTYLRELVWHGLLDILSYPRDAARRIAGDVSFTYPLADELALRRFERETKEVCDQVAALYGTDFRRSYVDEASAAALSISGVAAASVVGVLADLGGGTLDISVRTGAQPAQYIASIEIGGRQLLEQIGSGKDVQLQTQIRRAAAYDEAAFIAVCQQLDADRGAQIRFFENATSTVAIAILAALEEHRQRQATVTEVHVTLLGYGWWFAGFRDRNPHNLSRNVATFAETFEDQLRSLINSRAISLHVVLSEDPKRDVAKGALEIPEDAQLHAAYGVLRVTGDAPSEEALAKVTQRATFPAGIPCENAGTLVEWWMTVSPAKPMPIALHADTTIINMESFGQVIGKRLVDANIAQQELFRDHPTAEGRVRNWLTRYRVVNTDKEYYRGPFQVAVEARGRRELE
jgi:hypothetical protein